MCSSDLLKLELSRVAAARVSPGAGDASSMLLTVNQQQRAAEKEMELARSGALTETNAVAHAELKLEQANENLATIVQAYLKSLEIEFDVSNGRRQEMETQLEKLRETSKRSERKQEIEREVKRLGTQSAELSAEIELSRLSLRLLPESIQVGTPRAIVAR